MDKEKQEEVINRLIERYSTEVGKMLKEIGVPDIETFLLQKDELFKTSFHKADDILSLYDRVQILKGNQ